MSSSELITTTAKRLAEIREAAGQQVVLLGNIPPRDVLALGTAEDVRQSAADALADFEMIANPENRLGS